MDIFYEDKIEETCQSPKRSEPTQVSLQISQESKNHKHHGDFNFQFAHDLTGADHSKAAIDDGKFNHFSIIPPTNLPNVPQETRPTENLWGYFGTEI